MDNGTSTDPASTDPLGKDERAELLRLRSEHVRLRGEVAALRGQAAGTAAGVPAEQVSHPPRRRLRWTAAAILLVLVAVLAVLSVTTRFTRSQILDTDRYVSTVAPLGENPAVQAEITNQITDETFTRVDVEGFTADALTALTDVSNLAENALRLDQAVVGLAPMIAIGAYLTSGSASATAVRRGYGQALDFVRHSGSGRAPNQVERWANQIRVPLRCGIIGVAAVLLMFWRYPTGLVVLWIVLCALIALVALEVLIRPARTAVQDTGTQDNATEQTSETRPGPSS